MTENKINPLWARLDVPAQREKPKRKLVPENKLLRSLDALFVPSSMIRNHKHYLETENRFP
ncbi:MAG: hypothetical protein AABW50_04520 [Nanoarchaeota archaeon]